MTRRTYVVLGNPRGGTSAVAGLLRIFGIHMGDEVTPLTHEDVVLRDLIGQRLRAEIVTRNRRRAVWGFKDPTLIDRIDEVMPALRHPKFVVVLRNPRDVAMSEHRHTGRDVPRAWGEATLRHHRLTAFAADHDAATLTVEYEQLRESPADQIRRLATWCHVDADGDLLARAVGFVTGPAGYRTLAGALHHQPLPTHP